MSILIDNIINNKISKNEIIDIYKLSSLKFKYKIKNIIIIKIIYKIYQEKLDSEKNIFVANLFNKMQNKFPKKIFYANKHLVYKIFQISKNNYKDINKILLKLKPIEEQLLIREKNNERLRLKYSKMSILEKKQYRERKKNRRIKKIGIEAYNELMRNRFNKWYNSLSPERKENIKQKRNLKYHNLSFEEKQLLLIKKQEYKKKKLNIN